jgi:hypothetical protein
MSVEPWPLAFSLPGGLGASVSGFRNIFQVDRGQRTEDRGKKKQRKRKPSSLEPRRRLYVYISTKICQNAHYY